MIPDGVSVYETADYIEVTPKSAGFTTTGLMFYPGGFVDPHSYIRPLGIFARNGYKVVIFKLPANLGVLDPQKGLNFLNKFGGVTSWIAGGHSLGGTMACTMIKSSPMTFKGLVLFAAYPANTDSLAAWNRPVLSLTASNDGLSTAAEIDATKYLLPQGYTFSAIGMTYPALEGYTLYHVIQGGCHSYFGHYGMQENDGIPAISEDAQHNEISAYMNDFFTKTGNRP